MAIPWRVPALLGALLILGACGGGGGGGGEGPPSQPSPAPPQQPTPPPPAPPGGPLALTESNVIDATSLVMRPIERAHGAVESMILTAEVLYTEEKSSLTVSCAKDVLSHLSNTDRDRSGNLSPGDTLRYQFTSCQGLTRDTTMVIHALDYGAGTIEGSVTFEELTTAGVRSTGTFYLDSAFDHTTLEITRRITSLDVTVESGGATARISEAESVRYMLGDVYRLSLSGRATSSALGGEFAFRTEAPFSGRFGNVPTGGELELVGGASRARIRPATDPAVSDDQFAYQVDATGTGTYSSVRHGPWSAAVAGLIFCWDANTRPEITRLSVTPMNPTVRDQLTASYAATDADGDDLFYFSEWRINGVYIASGNNATLPLDRFRKGDVATFVLRVSDSRITVTAMASTTIVNTPPENVTVTFEPTVARTTDDIVIRYSARDIDQADYPQATFEWLRDGVVIPGQTGQVLPHTQQAKGQVITAVVHASDGEAVTSASASITIQDTPPVVRLPNEYNQVAYGQTVTFDAAASDADGDSIGRFVLSYGPAGMTVNPTTGRVSWPMRGPAFERAAIMNYGVTLDRPGANIATGVVVLDAPNREPALVATGLEGPIAAGLAAGDFDNDGDEELLVAGPNVLYELEWTGTGLRQSWVNSLPLDMTEPPTALATADVDGDRRHEIFIAHGHHVTKLDGVERRPQGTFNTGDYVTRDLEIADVDNDGKLDVVLIASLHGAEDPTAGAMLVRFGANAFGPFYDYPIEQGSAIAIGNVDNDADLEIVTNSGYVFDVFNWLNRWRYPTPFGWEIDVGDLDGNGVDEIVASLSDGSVRSYDGVTRTAKWTVANASTDTVVLADVVNDADEEVLIGDGSGGSGFVKVYAQTAPGTATLVAGVSAVGNDVPAITTGDVDNDGKVELIWGSTTPQPSISVAGGTPLDIEWSTADLDYGALLGPYVGGELARRPVGAPALLFATTRSAVGGARLLGMNPSTGQLTVSSDLGAPGNGNVALAIVDYDNDGTHEALLASSAGATAYHRAYDFFGATTEWNTTFASAQNGVAVAYGDIAGNSRVDFAAIDQQGVVRAYEVGASTPFWTSPALQNGRDVAIAELNGGGRPEIVVAAADRIRVYSRDGNANFVETRINASSLPDLRDIEIADIDGDGAVEIFALYGSATNVLAPTSVQRLDGTLAVRGGFDYWRWARGLTIERSTFARKNLVLTDTIEGEQVIVVDPDSGDEIWMSPALLGTIPRGGVHFVDVAGNGELRISVATSLGMYLTR